MAAEAWRQSCDYSRASSEAQPSPARLPGRRFMRGSNRAVTERAAHEDAKGEE